MKTAAGIASYITASVLVIRPVSGRVLVKVGVRNKFPSLDKLFVARGWRVCKAEKASN